MRAIRLLLLVALSLFTLPAWGADGLVSSIALNPDPDVPEYVAQAVNLTVYCVFLIVFGIMICWSIWHVHRLNFVPVIITFGGMLLCVLGIMAFYGQGPSVTAYAPWTASSDPATTTSYQWDTYGGAEGSPAHFASQAHAYEVQRGWALAGAVYSFRFIDVLFRFNIIPLIGIASTIYAVWMAYTLQRVRPLIVHMAGLIICVPIYLLPSVQYTTPTDANPMYNLLLQGASSSSGAGGAPPDAPRVSPFIASAFSVLTDLSQRVGERLAFGSHDPNSVLLQAALDARLTDGDFDLYMRYSSFCMTAVHSAVAQRTRKVREPEYVAFFNRLIGDPALSVPGGTVGVYNAAPVSFHHSLSPYADAMFQDVWVNRWVFFDGGWGSPKDFEDKTLYDGAFAMSDYPKAFTFHPNPIIGSGYLDRVIDDNGTLANPSNWHSTKALPMDDDDFQVDPVLIYAYYLNHGYHLFGAEYVPFCSLGGFSLTFNSYHEATSVDLLPPTFTALLPSVADRQRWLPVGWDDNVRYSIATRYIGPGSNDFCKAVSPDRQNEHLWGCLIAGKYRSDATEQAKSMHRIQTYFDTTLRTTIEAAIEEAVRKATVNAGTPTERYSGSAPGTYWVSGSFEYPANVWDFMALRNFNDFFFVAPGVASQIGLFGDYRQIDTEAKGKTDSWTFSMLSSIGGLVKPGIAGVFAWIATALAKIAMMMYPHAIGVMTFLLMLKSVAYCIRGICFGQYLYPVFHLLPGIAIVALMPLFIQIGLSFIEQGNGAALPALYIRSQAGADFGESIMSLVGAFFIISSFSLSATFITLGFGSIASVLGSVNSTTFKLTGAGLASISALAALATGVGAKVGSKVIDQALGTFNPPRLPPPPPSTPRGGPGGPGGGSSGPGGGGTSRPLPSGASGVQRELPTRSIARQTDRETVSAFGQHLIEAGNHSFEAAMAAGTAIAGTMALGNDGQHLAQGLGIGNAIGQRTGGAFLSAARAVTGITNRSGKSYDQLRNQRGEILQSEPINEGASADFSRVAMTYEKEASIALAAGDAPAASNTRFAAANAYRDAARLSGDPIVVGTNQLRAAESYTAAGSFDEATAQITAAEASYRRAGERASSPMQAGLAAAGMTELRALQLSHARAAGGGVLSESASKEYRKSVILESQRADTAFSAAGAFALEGALARPGEQGAWSPYGATAVARMHVAAITEDATGSPAVRPMLDSINKDLMPGIARKDREASVTLAALMAGAGEIDSARRVFAHGGLELDARQVEQIAKSIRAGDLGTLDNLIRRL